MLMAGNLAIGVVYDDIISLSIMMEILLWDGEVMSS